MLFGTGGSCRNATMLDIIPSPSSSPPETASVCRTEAGRGGFELRDHDALRYTNSVVPWRGYLMSPPAEPWTRQ
jgi:hypothetical protein